MMLKNSYLIESLAPLVFRSGKPFGSQASAQDVIFPLPSASAGLIRAIGIGQKQIDFTEQRLTDVQHEAYQKVLSIPVRGPFLVRYDQQDQYEILVAKPANALYFENRETSETELVRLAPEAFDDNISGCDLPKGLLAVQMQRPLKGKPQGGVNFWSLKHLIRWQQGEDLKFDEVHQLGLSHLPIDIRTHVAIDSSTQAGVSGKLFQTANLDLAHRKKLIGGWEEHRYGFIVQSNLVLNQDLATFGGERRLSNFQPIEMPNLQEINQQLLDKINQAKGFSLNFLSPAIFAKGYLPQWIDADSLEGQLPETSLRIKLKAVAIDRWLPVSGWDSLLWKPKSMRKAVAAGSVYWFELIDEMDLVSLQILSEHSFSDHLQDQRDGFGVTVIAPWSNIH